MAKGEIAHDEQFLILPQCFQLYFILNVRLQRFLMSLPRYFQSCLLQMCCMWERVKVYIQLLITIKLFTKWSYFEPLGDMNVSISLSHLQTHFHASAADSF